MIGKWNILAAVPFAFAIGACSSHESSVDTAAGTLSTDTSMMMTPAPSTPTPGIDTGMVLDTTKQADSAYADSLKKDTTKKAMSGNASTKKKAKKP